MDGTAAPLQLGRLGLFASSVRALMGIESGGSLLRPMVGLVVKVKVRVRELF